MKLEKKVVQEYEGENGVTSSPGISFNSFSNSFLIIIDKYSLNYSAACWCKNITTLMG